MTIIQIAPGVVFAAEALMPDWNREFRSTPAAARPDRPTASAPSGNDPPNDLAGGDTLAQGEQIDLLHESHHE
jgi:hypothetical protein